MKHHVRFTRRRGLALALFVLLALLLTHSALRWRGPASDGTPVAGGDALPATVAAHTAGTVAPDLARDQTAEDARRGFIARPTGKVLAADGSTVWDFDRFAFVDASGPAPATVNPSLWRQARLNNQIGLFKVRDGIHQLRGFDLANMTLIDGKTGWIVVDTLTTRETAAAALAFARRHLGDKPVSAVVFTHSHVDHFGGALGVVPADATARAALPVVAPQGFLEEATSENILIGPAMGRRATYQFGNLLPASGTGLVDSGLGKSVALGQIDVLAPTVTIHRTPQEMVLDGVRFVFQYLPESEAPAELAFFLPDLKAYCGAEILSQTMHNLYTLRGAKVRDALRWSGYIDEALQNLGDTEVFFASHHWPVWGNAAIADFMAKHRDTYRYIHDQTVRLLNTGLGPDDIADQLQLPPQLASTFAVRGYYGSVRHNTRAVYQHYLGWFDANPSRLDPLPRQQAATRYVALMGGADRTVAAAQSAFDAGEYRWVAELLNQVVFAQPQHAAAKDLLARTYEQLGYAAESAIWRNFYLSGALELRTGRTGNGPDPALAIGMLEQAPVERFLDAMAAAVHGPKAVDSRFRMNLRFSDTGASHVVWMENAVLHHRRAPPDPLADTTLTVTRPLFARLMTGTGSVKDLLLGDELKVDGSTIALLRFFSLIEKAPRSFAIVTPPG